MAEFVEIDLEQSVLELERLVAIDLFNHNDVKEIAQRRRDNLYSLKKRTKDKADFRRYISYEEDLLEKIAKKRKETGNHKRWVEIDMQMQERLHNFYRSCVERYQADRDIWSGYFDFCDKHKIFVRGHKMLQRLIQVHGDKEDTWLFASKWALKGKKEQRPNYETARTWLVKGIQRHPKSRKLYQALIELDLSIIAGESNFEMNDKEVDMDVIKKSIACAQVSYNNAIKNIPDAEFAADLMAMISKYPHTEDLQKTSLFNLEETFCGSEDSWYGRAIWSFENSEPPIAMDVEQLALYRLEKCIDVFKEAVGKLPTTLMWRKYIDFVRKHSKVDYYKRALPEAIKLNLAEPEDLAELADYYLSCDKGKKARKVLEDGLQQWPANPSLWYELLRVLLTSGEDEQAESMFAKATTELKTLPASDTSRLWTMMITYFLEDKSKQEKLESLFQNAMLYRTDLALNLKPRYLEWRNETWGLDSARQLMASQIMAHPPCLEVHRAMLAIECNQLKPDIAQVRRCFEDALRLFGKTNAELWMNYISFEKTHGDAKLIVKIYDRGIRTMDKAAVDHLVTAYALSF